MSLSNNNLEVKKDEGTRYDPVFREIISDIPGGVTLKSAEFPSDLLVLGAGTMIGASDTVGLYNICKTAKSDSTQTLITTITVVGSAKYRLPFIVGEFIAVYGKATISTISTITHTSDDTDTIITGTPIGTMTTADIIIRCAAAATVVAATQTAGLYAAAGFTRDVIKVREDDGTTLYNVNVGAVVRGDVNEDMLPYVVDHNHKLDLTSRMLFS